MAITAAQVKELRELTAQSEYRTVRKLLQLQKAIWIKQ